MKHRFGGLGFTVEGAAAVWCGSLYVGKWRAAAVRVVVLIELLHIVGRVAIEQLVAGLPVMEVSFGLHICLTRYIRRGLFLVKTCEFLICFYGESYKYVCKLNMKLNNL